MNSKEELFNYLTSAQVSRAEAEYSGGSDEGWLERPQLYDATGQTIKDEKISEMIRDFLYDHMPDGFGYDQMYGSALLSVAQKTITFDHTAYREVHEKYDL